jgi:ABC-type amino acid transport substrate-binding protein
VGTTSYTAITDQIPPTKKPAVYDTNDLAVQALKNHQVDGIVVDLPTAFYITAAERPLLLVIFLLGFGVPALQRRGVPISTARRWRSSNTRSNRRPRTSCHE